MSLRVWQWYFHPFGVGRSTLRPHHASATGAAALAFCSTSGGFQDGHPGLPVTARHGSSLSGRRLSIDQRRQSSSAAFCHIKYVLWETNMQQLWRQGFCSWVQSRFAETRFAETLTLTLTLNPNPNFGESGFGESGRHLQLQVWSCGTAFLATSWH